MSNRSSVWQPTIIGISIAIGILVGYVIQGRNNLPATKFVTIGKSGKLDEVLGYIDQKYVEEVDNEALSNAAIEEILSELDPHSYYLSAEEMSSVREEMTGNFEGIGIEFFIVNDTIMVVTPLSGGPSEALGIQSGDKIIMIDDTLVAGTGITNSGVVKRLKGPKGTQVKVSIKRNGKKDLIDYDIKRDKIPIYSVDAGFMVDDQTGYIKISRFNANTYREFREAMEPLEAAGIKNLVLDLRQNPGGYLEEAIKILDEFIDGRKELLYTKGRQHPKFTYNAKRPGVFENGELVVLIDQGSASASEILAGCVQDWDRGKIIGTRSFGKGLVQEQYDFSDGSAMRLTIAKYYTPSGRCIQKPYVFGDEHYDEDMGNRYDSGELFSADSIAVNDSLVYYTKILKRKVYGGGGIIPDVFVPFDTLGYDEFYRKLFQNGLMQQFAYDYYAVHKSDWNAYTDFKDFDAKFLIKGAIMTQFLAYVEDNGIDVPNTISPATESNIENRLKAYMAKQHWNGDGFYPVLLENDAVFKSAMQSLKDGKALGAL
ncbi:MAG: S41 family peptidase [Chitinophagales bacterium]